MFAPHLQPNKEALKDGHARTPLLKPRLDYNIATSWPVHNISAQNSLGSLILFYMGRLQLYSSGILILKTCRCYTVTERLNDRWEWKMNQYTKQKGFFLSRDSTEEKQTCALYKRKRHKKSFQHAKWKYRHLRVTYSIGIGEVSSISQPAAEVVVRASSAWHQQKRECITVTTDRSYIVSLRRNIRRLCSRFIIRTP